MARGSCLCGGVTFEAGGDLTPMQFCHAARCRKASGAAAAPEMLAPVAELRWLTGEDLVQVYEAPLLEEPPAYRRAFCRTCGSPLPCQITGTPFVMLNPGILDDDPGTRPFRHAFVGQKAVWNEVADDLPQFEHRPPSPTAGLPGVDG